MQLARISAENLRSIVHTQVDLSADFTFITGPNGAGKTNLLEAVALVSTLRPLTTTSPGELVRHGQAMAVAAGELRGGVLPLEVRVGIQNGRRRVMVAGKPLRDPEAFTGGLPVVAFTPDDMRLVKEGPGARRAFMSQAAGELWPGARAELRRLERALKQRNAGLRRGVASPVLHAMDEPLVTAAVDVWRRRERALAALQDHAQLWVARLLDGRRLGTELVAGLEHAAFAHADDEARAEALRTALRNQEDADRARGSTTSGPHHDELHVTLDGQDARRFASQGQQRCAALALTLAVVDAVHLSRGRPPLVLLDDVSSELDVHRRAALFEALAGAACQVVATATDVELLPLPPSFRGSVVHYAADAGTFTPWSPPRKS